jgi:hypothetical protein
VKSASRWQEIPLAQIVFDAPALALTGASDLERLKDSLTAVGLLNPPCLRPQPQGEFFQVVTGARRVQAASDLGWQQITARLLPRSTPDFHCLLVHLFDNAFSRGFNLWEQATLAARLCEYEAPSTVAAKYLPYLGLPTSPAHLARLLKTATLPAPWLRLAAQGRLALTAAATVAEWDPKDRDAAWPYFEGLRLSQSKQEEFLEQIMLLARREGVSAAAILAQKDLRHALTQAELTPPQRTEAVRRLLCRWFQPRLSAARQAFETTLGQLGWKRNPRFRLQPPPAFEGPDFHLEIKFRDHPELQQLLQEITSLVNDEEFSTLLHL